MKRILIGIVAAALLAATAGAVTYRTGPSPVQDANGLEWQRVELERRIYVALKPMVESWGERWRYQEIQVSGVAVLFHTEPVPGGGIAYRLSGVRVLLDQGAP